MKTGSYDINMGWDDPGEINISNIWETNYWCYKLNCSKEVLTIAVNEVGPKISKIKEFIVLISKLDRNKY